MAFEWAHTVWFRLKALLRRKQLDQDLQDEIAFHLSKREESIRKGETEAQQTRKDSLLGARRQFGNTTRIKESSRDLWSFPRLETFWQDICYSVRVMQNNPGFAAVAVLTLGLGIGVNAGVFSILNAAALRPLPIPRAGEVVSIAQILHGQTHRSVEGEPSLVSYPEYKAYRDQSHVLEGLVAYGPFEEATLGGQKPQRLNGHLASCNYFDVLHIKPALGRGFVASECAAPGESAVLVISDKLWRGVFDADPAIIGQTIRLNRTSFTVIGVAPPDFDGTEFTEAEFWAPITMQKAVHPGIELLSDADMSWLMLLGRVHFGVTLDQVRADLGVIAARTDQFYPGRQTRLAIQRATTFTRPDERPYVLAAGGGVLTAVGLVLLVVCANLANLFLARISGRSKEMSIRLTLGATRMRLARQIITETLMIALMGGVVGVFLAWWSADGIMAFASAQMPKDEIGTINFHVGPDWRVLAYAFGISLLTCLAFGLAPALRASKANINDALKSAGTAGASGRRTNSFSGRVLVGVQVAFSMILLLAAGLSLRVLYHAQTIDPGFEMKNTAAVTLDLAEEGYSASRANAFNRDLLRRLAALPGVDGVAAGWTTPLSGSHSSSVFSFPGRAGDAQIKFNTITPGFFGVLGIPIVRGRDFTEADLAAGGHVLIVTEAAARRFWLGEDPIGKGVLEGGEKQVSVVVGVAKDANVDELTEPHPVLLFLPTGKDDQARLRILVHNSRTFAGMAEGIRNAVHSLDPEILVNIASLDSNLEVWRAPSRIVAIVAGVLGMLALSIASLGVYGMVSCAVGRRTREIGIRMALGAAGANVKGLIVKQAMRPVIIGILVGIVGCAAVSKLLSIFLFGLSPFDPVVFLSVPAFLFAIALAACYLPARRAVRVDPMVVLRYE
ncbi:MAG TPA: ABC transporter permease [Candidatus Acidoferrales bacterium]|jgi:predicted permease|nr:ABC transporter permease [Candidatus Acidoferrales bacterium]